MPTSPTAVVWFRNDLRTDDNPALVDAVASGLPVVALYVHDEALGGEWTMGAAKRWWLHQNLEALRGSLAALNVPLVLRSGDAGEVVPAFADQAGAKLVVWNRRYAGFEVEQDKAIKAVLKGAGVEAVSFNGHLLREPWEVLHKGRRPFQVYTPFGKAWRALGEPEPPLDAPAPLERDRQAALPELASDDLASWGLEPTEPDWAGGMRARWKGGEAAGRERLAAFLSASLSLYPKERHVPGSAHNSVLSPWINAGALSVRRAWREVREAQAAGAPDAAAEKFLGEVTWREFSYHVLFHHPDLPDEAMRDNVRERRFREDPAALEAWRRGCTGFPIIDAAMRELWAEGWMSNRSRLNVAAFLTKDAGVHWRHGERWFWDCLIDADLANNATSWQWVVGAKTRAAPAIGPDRFAVAGEDRRAAYIREWAPELRGLSDDDIHRPWVLPKPTLKAASIELGVTYPRPCVDLNRLDSEIP